MKHIIKHFQTVDPVLAGLLAQMEFPVITSHDDHFRELCDVIISQQLSTKAAATIFSRFENLFPKKHITPETLLKLSDVQIRAVGTSGSKTSFLKNLAKAVVEKEIILEDLPTMTNEEIIVALTKLKGIGPWSADMFLMFSLGREDVFSYGDLGLRRAIQKLYKMKSEPTQKQVEKISKPWSPYRTYAARILWKSLELK